MQLVVQSDDGNVVRVKVSGQITQSHMNPTAEPLGDALKGDYTRKILLNFREAQFLDSSGVGWLLTCHKRVRQAVGKLVMHSMQTMVRNVLLVLRMNKVFFMAKDEAEALKMLSQTETAADDEADEGENVGDE